MLGAKGWATWTRGSGPSSQGAPLCVGFLALPCRAGALGLAGLGLGTRLSPQTAVGSCIHSANQLAREVRGRCAAQGPHAPLELCGPCHT